MDIATIIGFIAGVGTVLALMLMGGSVTLFLDYHAALVIGGGCFASTLIRFPLSTVMSGLATGGKLAFSHGEPDTRELVDEITTCADIARTKGPLGLEKAEVDAPLLAKGVTMIADGHKPEFIRESLEKERDMNIHRLEDGVKVYKAIGDCAPAFGMIGTLIGMVQMFANMTDPSKLGPFMAIALLATLYGAVVSNLICLPIADKLEKRLSNADIHGELIIDGVMQICESRAPAVIREMLQSYLPEKHREQRLAEAA